MSNKLYIVGIGPGDYEGMTVAAVRTLEKSQVIVGYTLYCELVKPHFPDKYYISTPMKGEVQRCRDALECAASGKVTSIICSGDAGIYGMSSPVYELSVDYEVDIEVVAGVTAASSGCGLLGSPLTHDFAVISLSDLLTPSELIEKRVDAAASADMCIVLYNPASRKRTDCLSRACELALRHKSGDTVCGVTRNIGRTGEESLILSLSELRDYKADMFTTVFIGNSATKIINGKMVTPRGYMYE